MDKNVTMYTIAVSFTNKTDRHELTETLLKAATTQTLTLTLLTTMQNAHITGVQCTSLCFIEHLPYHKHSWNKTIKQYQ
jgi:hypothetical protein